VGGGGGGVPPKKNKVFFPIFPDFQKKTVFFLSFPGFERLSENNTKMNMSIGHWWNDANRIKPR